MITLSVVGIAVTPPPAVVKAVAGMSTSNPEFTESGSMLLLNPDQIRIWNLTKVFMIQKKFV
jgi:hypothetical protein